MFISSGSERLKYLLVKGEFGDAENQPKATCNAAEGSRNSLLQDGDEQKETKESQGSLFNHMTNRLRSLPLLPFCENQLTEIVRLTFSYP
jgi:hypothetical protein